MHPEEDLLGPCIEALSSYLSRLAEQEPGERVVPKRGPLHRRTLPEPLQDLEEMFALTDFERDLLFLCAGVVLDMHVTRHYLAVNGGKTSVSFAHAMSILPSPHWSALSPYRPLRYFRLVISGDGTFSCGLPETPIATSLRIDERILGHLVGVDHISADLRGYLQPVEQSESLPSSHARIAERLGMIWSSVAEPQQPPLITLCGPNAAALREIVAATCRVHELPLFRLDARDIPAEPRALAELSMLWLRETMLTGGALLVDCHGLEPHNPERDHLLWSLIEKVGGYLVLATDEPRQPRGRAPLVIRVDRPPVAEQRELWRDATPFPLSDQMLNRLSTWFSLDAPAIRACCAAVTGSPDDEEVANGGPESIHQRLWQTCRVQARRDFQGLAHRIKANATWNRLCLPTEAKQQLHDIAGQVRQRHRVHEEWGLAETSSRGLGTSVLFAGPSGTGKTMAAEVLAGELDLDLYAVDLSVITDKYVGETQKHLRRVFDAAEAGGCILLFDEADALFSTRTETKDSLDRHANNEVSFLLHKMEAYRGISILTSNFKEAIDKAFMRRLRFVVNFPFPEQKERRAIWQDIFPPGTPLATLDFDKLAQLNITGGNIRNIAVNALFIAADGDSPVTMSHIARAARAEYEKLNKSLTGKDLQRLLA